MEIIIIIFYVAVIIKRVEPVIAVVRAVPVIIIVVVAIRVIIKVIPPVPGVVGAHCLGRIVFCHQHETSIFFYKNISHKKVIKCSICLVKAGHL